MGWGAAASGGLGLIGDIMNAQSQEQTNMMNFQIAQMNNDFNAQQAALNRGFQQNMMSQAEQFSAGMADTQVTRRMQDLQNAGLNPQLAVGNPAASPMIGAPSGSQAQASGNPIMQNPGAAFSQLGTQTAQALSLGSQMKLQSAQADQAEEQAKLTHNQRPTNKPQEGDDPDQGIDMDAMGGHALGNANLKNIQADTNLKAEEKTKVANLANYIIAQQYNVDADTGQKNIQNAIAGQEYKILMATKDALIQEQLRMGTAARNEMGVDNTAYGRGISYINRALPAVGTALEAVGVGGFLKKSFGGKFNINDPKLSGGEVNWPQQ